jgi:hypothetical protein
VIVADVQEDVDVEKTDVSSSSSPTTIKITSADLVAKLLDDRLRETVIEQLHNKNINNIEELVKVADISQKGVEGIQRNFNLSRPVGHILRVIAEALYTPEGIRVINLAKYLEINLGDGMNLFEYLRENIH